MEGEKATTMICTVLAMDHSNFCYRVCSACEKTLPDDSISISISTCCNSASKRLFRILISVASDSRVFTVVCFDRAARVLFGCSADDFFNLAKLHPFAAVDAGKVLEGEMCRMTLSKPKNWNAQHLRVAAIAPLSSGFQPAIITLQELYGVAGST